MSASYSKFFKYSNGHCTTIGGWMLKVETLFELPLAGSLKFDASVTVFDSVCIGFQEEMNMNRKNGHHCESNSWDYQHMCH